MTRLFFVCRVLESLLVAMVTTVVIFVSSMLLGECRELSSPTTQNTTVNTGSAPIINVLTRSPHV